jgi:hypothetical protein
MSHLISSKYQLLAKESIYDPRSIKWIESISTTFYVGEILDLIQLFLPLEQKNKNKAYIFFSLKNKNK